MASMNTKNNNNLETLDAMLFNSQTRLQYVDLSHNSIKSLPEQLFQRTDLEMFRASDNKLTEIPIKALNPVQSSLKFLDLDGNGGVAEVQLLGRSGDTLVLRNLEKYLQLPECAEPR